MGCQTVKKKKKANFPEKAGMMTNIIVFKSYMKTLGFFSTHFVGIMKYKSLGK